MKRNLTFLSLLLCLSAGAQQGWWTWMKGNNTAGSVGNYGTKGVAAPANTPPGLYEGGEWTDLQGNFWLFGGLSASGNGSERAALWKFSPVTNNWTWVHGPNTMAQAGVYGTQGVPSVTNNPGSRSWGMVTWTDLSGDLWLFGGQGYDVSGSAGNLSDLWRYNIATDSWTWMNGPNVKGQSGNYGAMGVAAATNQPQSRYESVAAWTANNGNLYMFGGGTFNPSFGNLNDMWMYNISTNMWTWMRGSNTVNSPGNYGTMGVAAPTNDPRARCAYSRFKDSNGNLWFFGGGDFSTNTFNDLWKYDVAANEWTWMHGSATPGSNGSISANCTFAATNDPSSRSEGRIAWSDHCGNFWLYGGARGGSDDTTWADLWYYKTGSNQWARVSGTAAANGAGSYGTITVPAATNHPSSRTGGNPYYGPNGTLWFFGGTQFFVTGHNDVWRFVPDTTGCTPNTCAVLEAAFAADTVCVNTAVNFTNTSSGATSYSWDFGDTQTSTLTNPTHTYTTAGNYTVSLIASNGTTTDTSLQTVAVHPKPTASITGNDTVCAGASTILTGAGGGTYSWNTGAVTAPITVSPALNTTYTLVVSNGFCKDTSRVMVIVKAGPSVEAGNDTTINLGTSITLDAVGTGTTYSWYPSTGLSCTTCANPTATPLVSTYYIVRTTDARGCSSSDTIFVLVRDDCGELFVPNFFSPNNDGKNDKACVYGGCITALDFTIFDRWGETVYHTNDPKECCWDGSYNGQLMNSAVFVYYLKATLLTGQQVVQKGNITLMR